MFVRSKVFYMLVGITLSFAALICMRAAKKPVVQEPASEYPPPTTSVSLEDKLHRQSKIVFVSSRDGNLRDRNNEIYVMNADGQDIRRLTYDIGWSVSRFPS